MKRIAKVMALLMVALAGFSAYAKKKTLNIMTYNDEFEGLFNKFYSERLPDDVEVNWIRVPAIENSYQDTLNEFLAEQKSLPASQKIDMFVIEPDYADEYVNSTYTVDLYKLGITKSDVADQYDCMKKLMTDKKGALKGVAYLLSPGGFIYRRSIAEEVFGTDDPDAVGEYLSDWKKYEAAAEKLYEAGYCITSGPEDSFRCFYGSRKSAFVEGNKLKSVKAIDDWISMEKRFTEKGYNRGNAMWTMEWMNDLSAGSNVFGYFSPLWFSDYVIGLASYQTDDWAYCKGPKGFIWGGNCLCAASGSDDLDLVADIMRAFTCDYEIMDGIMNSEDTLVNNREVVAAHFDDEDFARDMLRGQIPVKILSECADEAELSFNTKYDSQLISIMQMCMMPYFNGNASLKNAWDAYYSEAVRRFHELKK